MPAGSTSSTGSGATSWADVSRVDVRGLSRAAALASSWLKLFAAPVLERS
jgi:hypothetical protein